jgi:hypothetical protein
MPLKRQLEAKKSKWDFLKHPLLVAIVAAIIGLIAVYIKSSSVSSTINNGNIANSNSDSVGGNNYGQVAGGNIINNQTVVTQSEIQRPKEQWQPPELPEECKNVYLMFGGTSTEMTIEEIKKAHYLFMGGFEPIKWRVNSNRFYIDVAIPLGDRIINVKGGRISAELPPKWDMNFNSNAVEIVAENNNPLYQVIYRRPDQVVVNGIFSRGDFLISATTNGFEWWTGKSNVATTLRGFYSGTTSTGFKPIFKYPAWHFPGKYVN